MRRGWVVFLLAGCSAASGELRVDLRTDWGAGEDFVFVRSSLDGATPRETMALADANFLEGVRIATWESVSPGVHEIGTELVDASGALVASQRTVVRVDGSTGVTVLITRDCANVRCPREGDSPEAVACVAGRCVDPGCAGTNLDRCGEPQCVADLDCETGLACVVGECRDGLCFQPLDPAMCTVDEVCDATVGCLSIDACERSTAFICDDFDDPDAAWIPEGEARLGILDSGESVFVSSSVAGDASRFAIAVDPDYEGPFYMRSRIFISGGQPIDDFVVLLELMRDGGQKVSFDVQANVLALNASTAPINRRSMIPAPRSRWFCAEMFVDVRGDASGSAWLRIDDELAIELSDIVTRPPSGFELAAIGAVTPSMPIEVYYDDVYIGAEVIGCD